MSGSMAALSHGEEIEPIEGRTPFSRMVLENLLVFSRNRLARSRNRWGGCYARCRDRGKPHGKALKAVARKRLKVICAVMRGKVPCAA